MSKKLLPQLFQWCFAMLTQSYYQLEFFAGVAVVIEALCFAGSLSGQLSRVLAIQIDRQIRQIDNQISMKKVLCFPGSLSGQLSQVLTIQIDRQIIRWIDNHISREKALCFPGSLFVLLSRVLTIQMDKQIIRWIIIRYVEKKCIALKVHCKS